MSPHRAKGHLKPTPPYEFPHTQRYMLTEGLSAVVGDTPHTVTFPLRSGARPILIELRSLGKVESPLLHFALLSDIALEVTEQKRLETHIRFYLGLNDDVQPLYTLGWDDDPFAEILEEWYGYHLVKFTAPFAAATFALLVQELAEPAARLYWRRLQAELGDALLSGERTLSLFPAAATVAANRKGLQKTVADRQLCDQIFQLARAFAAAEPDYLAAALDGEGLASWLIAATPLQAPAVRFTLLRGYGVTGPLELTPAELRSVAGGCYGPELTMGKLDELRRHYRAQQGYWYHYLSLTELENRREASIRPE